MKHTQHDICFGGFAFKYRAVFEVSKHRLYTRECSFDDGGLLQSADEAHDLVLGVLLDEWSDDGPTNVP